MKPTKIIIAWSLLLLLHATNTFAQEPPSPLKDTSNTTTRCVSGNCENGHGKYIFDNGYQCEGDFVNSIMERQGTYTVILHRISMKAKQISWLPKTALSL